MMARSNKGIRDIVKDNRGSEQRPPSSSNLLGSGLPQVTQSKLGLAKGLTGPSGGGGGLLMHKSLNIGISDAGDPYAQSSQKTIAKSIEHDKVKEAILTDLRQQTDKFFMGGMQNNENFLPEIKDKNANIELRRMVEDMRKELEARNTTIQALQRNFESLSALCLNERAEKANLLKQNEQLRAENKDYAQQLLAAHEKIEKQSADITSLVEQKKKLEKIKEEFLTTKSALESTKALLQDSKSKQEQQESEIERLKKRISELLEKVRSMEGSIKDQDKVKEEFRKQVKEFERQIEELQLNEKKSLITINDRDLLIANLRRQIEDEEKKANEYLLQMKKKDLQIRELEVDVDRERKHKREIERNLKDATKAAEDVRLLLKSGEMSQDELKKKLAETMKKLHTAEEQIKQEKQMTELLTKECMQEKEEAQRQVALMQKEGSYYRDTIKKLEQKSKEDSADKVSLQQAYSKLQEAKFAIEQDLRTLEPILIHKDKQLMDLGAFIQQLKGLHEKEKTEQREEYLRAFQRMKDEISTLRSEGKGKFDELAFYKKEVENKDGEILQMKARVKELEMRIEKILNEKKDVGELQMRISILEQENNHQMEELAEVRGRYEEALKNMDMLRKEQDSARSSQGGFEESLQKLKKQIADNERVIQQLSQAKSDMNSKMLQLNKDKNQLEMDASKLKAELKALKDEKEDIEKKADAQYKRLEESTMKVMRLEKDLELEQEVTKKRHEEINSLIKENAKYKGELDEIRKAFGNMQEIEARIKIAEVKEEKIFGLLNQLDQIFKSEESNLSCYTCMNMMTDPTVMVPCGHAYCKKCITPGLTDCPQCEKRFTSTAPIKILQDLCTKFVYKRDALSMFKNDSFWKSKAGVQ
ncbi:hypothetical protein FGO68_gene4873 [Halteria grandinella]|uniref:RING-type domain-containing protein n=1 Tax=Halteria grandinella TaxID=5974 RepID=A0A8J8P5K6_HALGN|nr:hypothetical protein FGO68_gene4873 [Halteria grandinella]